MAKMRERTCLRLFEKAKPSHLVVGAGFSRFDFGTANPFSSSLVRALRRIFSLRWRLNLDLSPLILDMLSPWLLRGTVYIATFGYSSASSRA